MSSFNSTTALITGASRGLGYQLAKLLALKGIHIIGLARTIGGLEDLSDEITAKNGSATMIPLNLENDNELNNLAQTISMRWRSIDIFIHCASIPSPTSPVTSISLKDFDKSLTINTRATLKLIQIMDPFIKVSRLKTAIFIDDKNSGKFLSSYASSKAATREIVDSYKEESKRIGVTAMTFIPLPMRTSLRARFYPGESRQNLVSCESQAKKLISMVIL